MNAAAEAAHRAFKEWQDTSILTRQQVMFKFQQKIKDNMVGKFIKMGDFDGSFCIL